MRPDLSLSLFLQSRRMLCAAAALGMSAVAMPAMAQDAPALRYLDWNGRPEPVATARATPAGASEVPALRPAPPVIPHAGSQSMAAVPQLRPATSRLPIRSVDADGRPGLTPAEAFFTPPAVQTRVQPAPVRVAEVAPAPVTPSPVRQLPAPRRPAPGPPPPRGRRRRRSRRPNPCRPRPPRRPVPRSGRMTRTHRGPTP